MFFHNFRGYDSHHIVRALANFPQHKIGIIGQGMEKYLSLRLGKNIVFKDTLQFMPSSLETLANNLRKSDPTKLQPVIDHFGPNKPTDLLLRKGVFPYEYIDDWAKLDEDHLPPREAFFSTLKQEECSEEDYAHAQRVWTEFNCRTLRDYLDLYLALGMSLNFF